MGDASLFSSLIKITHTKQRGTDASLYIVIPSVAMASTQDHWAA